MITESQTKLLDRIGDKICRYVTGGISVDKLELVIGTETQIEIDGILAHVAMAGIKPHQLAGVDIVIDKSTPRLEAVRVKLAYARLLRDH